MSSNATAVAAPAIPAEVTAFAAEHGVSEYVAPLLQMTLRAFPGAPLSVEVEEDAEEFDMRLIVFLIDVTGWDLDRLSAADDEWVQGLMRICPGPVRPLFTIGIWGSS